MKPTPEIEDRPARHGWPEEAETAAESKNLLRQLGYCTRNHWISG